MACIAQDQLSAIATLKQAYTVYIGDVNPDYLLVNNIVEGQTMVADLSAEIKTATEIADYPLIQKTKENAARQPGDALVDSIDTSNSSFEKWFKDCIPCDKRLFADPINFLAGGPRFNGQNLIGKLFIDPYIASALKQLETIASMKRYLTGFYLLDDICAGIRAFPPFVCVPDLMALATILQFQLGDLLKDIKFPKPGKFPPGLNAVLGWLLMPLVTAALAYLKQLVELLLKPLDCLIAAMKTNLNKLKQPDIQFKKRKKADGALNPTIEVQVRPGGQLPLIGNGIDRIRGSGNNIVNTIQEARDRIYKEFEKLRKLIEEFAKNKLKKDVDTIDKLIKIKNLKINLEIINTLLALAKEGKSLAQGDYKRICNTVLYRESPLAAAFTANIDPTLDDFAEKLQRSRSEFWNGQNKVSSKNKQDNDGDFVKSPVKDIDSIELAVPSLNRRFLPDNSSVPQQLILSDNSIDPDFFTGTEIDELLNKLPFDLNELAYEDDLDGSFDFNRLDLDFIDSYTSLKEQLRDLNGLPDPADSDQKSVLMAESSANNQIGLNSPKGLIIGVVTVGSCFQDKAFSNSEINKWLTEIGAL